MASKYSYGDDDDNNIAGGKDADGRDYYPDEGKRDHNETADAKDSKGSGGTSLSEDELLDCLQAYFFEDDALSGYFEGYIRDHCHIVDLENEEYKLAYTEVYNDYKSKFESKMEDYIENTLHCSITDVYRALKHKMDADENSMGAFFAQILIAVTDFDVFMTVMRESARQRKDSHK